MCIYIYIYIQKTNDSSTQALGSVCSDLAWASLEQRAGQPLEKGQLPLTEVEGLGWEIILHLKGQEFV